MNKKKIICSILILIILSITAVIILRKHNINKLVEEQNVNKLEMEEQEIIKLQIEVQEETMTSYKCLLIFTANNENNKIKSIEYPEDSVETDKIQVTEEGKQKIAIDYEISKDNIDKEFKITTIDGQVIIKKTAYNISLNFNDGTGRISNQKILIGKKYRLDLLPTRDGYVFLAWNTQKDESGYIYNVGDEFAEETDKTLYAIWDSLEYEVIFDANGGTVSTTRKAVKYNETYGDLPSPTRDGYDFTGWYTLASGGEKIITTTKYTIIGNKTLYAHWELKKYTITYNANGGSGTPGNQTKTHGQTIALSTTKPTRKYYTFLGWSTNDKATSATYGSGASYVANGNVTLYAVWKSYSEVIIYNSGTSYYPTKVYSQSGTVSFNRDCITMTNVANKTITFNNAFSNNYRYLKVTARSIKNSSLGNYNISRFFVSNTNTADSIYCPTGILAQSFIANGSSSNNVTSYTTFTLDLNSVNNSTYYVGLHNCDSDFYIQKIWLTN